jgi:hypothetical protein
VEISKFPENSNPFHFDAYHMGSKLGNNVTIMFPNHSDTYCSYVIIINTFTGERIKVLFDGTKVDEGNGMVEILNSNL